MSEENDEGILKKIYGALNEVLHREKESNNTEEKEKSDMSEDENEEESKEENEECEETEHEEQCDTPYEELIKEKDGEIETLEKKVSELEEQVEEYREKEYDELVKEAVEVTTMDEEAIRECDSFTVKTLIEGARSSRNALTESEENGNKESGKNLRSPPGGSEDYGPEVVDVYSHPLDE